MNHLQNRVARESKYSKQIFFIHKRKLKTWIIICVYVIDGVRENGLGLQRSSFQICEGC